MQPPDVLALRPYSHRRTAKIRGSRTRHQVLSFGFWVEIQPEGYRFLLPLLTLSLWFSSRGPKSALK